MADKIKVTLIKSLIGQSEKQKKVVNALGLGKVDSFTVHEDTPNIRGMINKVSHLVAVEKVEA